MSFDCFCDYDPPAFYDRSTPRARKQHICEECGVTIQPGETYERVVGKWDGHLSTFATCERCHDLRQYVENSVPCFCWAHGSMLDDAAECMSEARYHADEAARGFYFAYLRRRYAIQVAKGYRPLAQRRAAARARRAAALAGKDPRP